MGELTREDKLQLIGQLKRREKELFETLYHAFDGRQRYPVPVDDEAMPGHDDSWSESGHERTSDTQLGEELELLECIELALRHAEVKQFGKCIDCGAIIPTRTLRLRPWTIRCTRHQGIQAQMTAAATGL